MSRKRYNSSFDKVATEMSNHFDVCPFCHDIVLDIHIHIANEIECNKQYMLWRKRIQRGKLSQLRFPNHPGSNPTNASSHARHNSEFSCIHCQETFEDLKRLTHHINTTPSCCLSFIEMSQLDGKPKYICQSNRKN